MRLYHGSIVDIKSKYLKPNLPFLTKQYAPAIYFSDKYELALLYSINPIRAYIKRQKIKKDANAFSCYFRYDEQKVIVYECYKGMLDETYNNSSFIYVADIIVTEKHIDNTGYYFTEPIKYNKKLLIKNVLLELLELEKNNKIEIIRYEDLTRLDKNFPTDSLSSRANECETEAEILFFKDKFADNYEIQKYLKLNKTTK